MLNLKNDLQLPLDIYLTQLQGIQHIKFSLREIDIIACILHGRTAKIIASFLAISPKTVEANTSSIISKIGCGSRQGIIDFIEKSGEYGILKTYYSALLIKNAFEEMLHEIAKNILKKGSSCTLICNEEQKKSLLTDQLKKHLELMGMMRIHEKNDRNYSTGPVVVIAPPSDQPDASIDLIDFGRQDNYYNTFFTLLKKLVPDHELNTYVAEFAKQCESLFEPTTHRIDEEVIPVVDKPKFPFFHGLQVNKRWAFSISAIVVLLGGGSGVFYVYSFPKLTWSFV